MTRIGKVFALVAAALYLVAVVNDQPLSYMMCWTTLSLVVTAFLLARMTVSGVEVKLRRRTVRCFAGGEASVTVSLRNRGSLNKTNLLVELPLRNSVQGTAVAPCWHVPSLEAGETLHETLRFPVDERGVLELRGIRVRGGDPLGLFTTSRTLPVAAAILVYPRPIRLPTAAAAAGAARRVEAAGRRGSGENDYRTVRPYVAGDDLRRIHWPTTARTGRLAVKEFEPPLGNEAMLAVAVPPGVSPEERTALETTLCVAAAAAQAWLQQGSRLSLRLLSPPPVRVSPGRGPLQETRILDALARVTPSDPAPSARLLQTFLPALSVDHNLVLVTSSLAPSLTAAVAEAAVRGIRVHVLHAVGPEPENESPSERDRSVYCALRALTASVQRVPARPVGPVGLSADEASPRRLSPATARLPVAG